MQLEGAEQDPNTMLPFEDEGGMSQLLSLQKLREILNEVGSLEYLKVAVLACCYSKDHGQLLLKYGAQHVVATIDKIDNKA